MVNINKLSKLTPKIQQQARSFVSGMGNGEALAPIYLLEATVIAGRTEQAHKRGGFIEARERVTEEILGAIFWLGGVNFFNHVGDIIGKKALKLTDVKFDTGQDSVRKPVSNYMSKLGDKGINPKGLKIGKTGLAAFKFSKILTSVLLANALIGFVVPKMNQAITRRYQKSVEGLDKNYPELMKSGVNLDEFGNKKKKDLSFKGGNFIQTLLSTTHKFEHDATYKLLSTDVGTAGGRTISARNKNEKIEVLFRDVASIYFYLFCRNHLNTLFNKMEDGRPNRLDPVSSNQLHNRIGMTYKQNNIKSLNHEQFLTAMLGNEENAKIPETMKFKAPIKKGGIETITLEEFKAIETNAKKVKIATAMSKLQPLYDGQSILTKAQVLDVYKGGSINNPRFLNRVYRQFTNGKSVDPCSYVAEKDLMKLKQNMKDYVLDIAEKAKASNKEIDMSFLKKMNKQNYVKNIANLGLGFAVAAYFLSTAIPKAQYWITKKLTGKDEFPGVPGTKK